MVLLYDDIMVSIVIQHIYHHFVVRIDIMFSCFLINKEKNNSLVPSGYILECNAVYKRKSYS